ncbi:MAG: hypothetical protein WD751_00400 [Anaerolineales bacterium]
MINTTNTILAQRPKAFDSVGVDVSQHVDFLGVRDRFVRVSHRRQSFVGVHFIRVHAGSSRDVGIHNRKNGNTPYIWDNISFNRAAALSHPKHSGLTFRAASAFAVPAPAEITFVHFNVPVKWGRVLKENMANLFAHSPRGLVSNARLSFDLLSGNATARLRHLINHKKPKSKGCAGFMENGIGGRGKLVSAKFASVNLTSGNAIKLRLPSAIRAFYNFGIATMTKPIKAGIIIGELGLKILDRKLSHLAFGSHFASQVYVI